MTRFFILFSLFLVGVAYSDSKSIKACKEAFDIPTLETMVEKSPLLRDIRIVDTHGIIYDFLITPRVDAILAEKKIVDEKLAEILRTIEKLVRKYLITSKEDFIKRVQLAWKRKRNPKATLSKEDREFLNIRPNFYQDKSLKLGELKWEYLFSLKLPTEIAKKFIRADEDMVSPKTYEYELESFPILKIFLYGYDKYRYKDNIEMHDLFGVEKESKDYAWPHPDSYPPIPRVDEALKKNPDLLTDNQKSQLKAIVIYIHDNNLPSLTAFLSLLRKAKQRKKQGRPLLEGDQELQKFNLNFFRALKIVELGGAEYLVPKPIPTTKKLSYEEIKAIIAKKKHITSFYSFRKAKEKGDPDLKDIPRDLYEVFAKEIEKDGKDVFFSNHTKVEESKKLKTLNEHIKVVRKYGFKTYKEYKEGIENDPYLKEILHLKPWRHFPKDWIDRYHFFGTKRPRSFDLKKVMKIVHDNPRIRSRPTYEKVRVEENLQDELPGDPYGYFRARKIWPGWPAFIGSHKFITELEFIDVIVNLGIKNNADFQRERAKAKPEDSILKVSSTPGKELDLKRFGLLEGFIKRVLQDAEKLRQDIIDRENEVQELLDTIRIFKITSRENYVARHPGFIFKVKNKVITANKIKELERFPVHLETVYSRFELEKIDQVLEEVDQKVEANLDQLTKRISKNKQSKEEEDKAKKDAMMQIGNMFENEAERSEMLENLEIEAELLD